MSKRVSHSLLDPLLTRPLKGLYPRLGIPAGFPPEGIVAVGHLVAIAGAVGFAFSANHWWGGLLAAAGVALNHTADVLDGTHARASGQCRNGGELLDHFVDPLSFSYWVAGLSWGAGNLLLGLGGVMVIYAMALLTSIKAKMIGEFTLARFGPTEFKTLLIGAGLVLCWLVSSGTDARIAPQAFAWWFLLIVFFAGLVQLKISLWRAIHEVNAQGAPPDTTEWQLEASDS